MSIGARFHTESAVLWLLSWGAPQALYICIYTHTHKHIHTYIHKYIFEDRVRAKILNCTILPPPPSVYRLKRPLYSH